MKIEVCIEQGQDPKEALEKIIKEVKGISSFKELRALQEKMTSEGYGKPEDMMETEEEDSEGEEPLDASQPMTTDEMAESEDKEKRTKNSKYPTTVGRMMK